MVDLRIVHFLEPEAFVDAVKPFDDSYMNFALGGVLNSMKPDHPLANDRSVNVRTLLAIYKGDKLLITLSKIKNDFSWVIASPHGAEEDLSPKIVSDAISLLVSRLYGSVDDQPFDNIIGPVTLVDTFLETWVSHAQTQGLRLKVSEPYLTAQVTFATLASLPPPSPAFSHLKITMAQTEEDADAVAPLSVDFRARGPARLPVKFTLEDGIRTTRIAVRMKQIWLCRVDGEVAGYVMMGRLTPRTIAIRNVYVAPAHRRKGIAEAMVRALTRFYLGAEPLGFEGAPSLKPDEGTRDEVCLNVAEEAVARLYRRCGFLLGPDDHDLVGKKGSFDTYWRGVEPL